MTTSLATDAHGAMLQHVLEEYEPALVRRVERVLRGLTRQAHARFLRHQETLTAAGEPKERPASRSKSIRIPIPAELANAREAHDTIETVLEQLRGKTTKTVVFMMSERLGISFDVRNQLLDGVIAGQSGMAITTAPEELVRVMMASLQASYDAGDSIPRAARKMRAAGYEHSRFYAERIARTELIGSSNAASLALVHATGAAKYKVWMATNDGRTRPAHRAADGQTVGIRDSFSVGGSQMQYPGDPNAPSDLVVMCRCALGYSDDANLDLIAGGNMATVAEEQETAVGASWSGPIAQEGIDTGDGRFFAAGAFEWRELPLTLMAQHTTPGAGGHAEAQVAGRIDTLERVGGDIMGAGVFDTGEWGQETERLVTEGVLKGISVDFSPQEYDVIPSEEDPENPFMASVSFSRAIILGATIVPFPAFENAMIAITAGAAMHAHNFRMVDGEPVGSFFMPFLTAAIGDEAPEDEGGDAAEAVADIRAAVNGYPGLDGQVVVTISGEETTIPFPAEAAEDEPAAAASAEVEAAFKVLREALRAKANGGDIIRVAPGVQFAPIHHVTAENGTAYTITQILDNA